MLWILNFAVSLCTLIEISQTANYGENCQQSGCVGVNQICSPTNSTCVCNTGYIENPSKNGCVAGTPLGQSCSASSQCLTTNSECSGNPQTCQCQSGYFSTGSSCEKRNLGETCSDTSQCSATNSVCNGGTCACKSDYFTVGTSCLKRSLGETCSDTSQCSATNSVCNGGTCVCKSDYFTVGTSCLKRSIGETCSDTSQCSALDSVCNGGTGTCVCKSDYFTVGTSCLKRTLGETCSDTTQCSVTNSECNGGTCKCKTDYFNTGTSCLKRNLGETCTITSQCSATNLECNAGTCSCKSDYYSSGTSCLLKRNLGETCSDTSQCSATNSVCNSVTCVCKSDYFTVGTSCLKRTLGETCSDTTQCSATNSECNGGTCKCKSDYFNTGTSCLKRNLGDTCSSTSQCSATNSECNGVTCVCKSDYFAIGTNCLKRSLGETCSDTSQCSALNSVCNSGTCVCKSDYFTVGTSCLKRNLGETCSDTSQCSATNSVCSGGTCVCKSDYFTFGTSCLKRSLGESCSDNSQCTDQNAVCYGTCQCPPGFYDNNGLSVIGGQCVPKNTLQSACPTPSTNVPDTVTCLDTNARCSVFGSSYACQCISSYYDNKASTNRQCAPKRTLGETCSDTSQCSAPNSECNGVTCVCKSEYFKVGTSCLKRNLGETCSNTSQCSEINSVCNGGTCACKSDYFTVGTSCLKRNLGETCSDTSQCSETNSVCNGVRCVCKSDYFTVGTSCLKRNLGETCSDTSQCSAFNSVCNGVTCVCKSDYFKVGTSCLKRFLGESCSDNSQCSGQNAVCYGTCQCPAGFYDNNGLSVIGGDCVPNKSRPTITVTDVQTKSITVTWIVDNSQREQTTLFTINLKTERPAMNIVKTVEGLNVSTLVVKELEEYWNYTVTLEMSTTAGTFISEPVTIRTLQSAPGPVTDFVVITNANGDYRDSVITWKSPAILEINGVIIRYAFTSNATINETTYLDAVLPIDHTYAVSADVTPDEIYRFEVYAINSLNQKGTVTTKEVYAPAGIPPNTIEDVEGNGVISKVHDVSQTKITVTLVKEFFQQSQHGVIRATGLIICAKDKCDIGASLNLHQFNAMKSWQIASKEGFSAYRVTRDNWLTEAQDTTRQKRRRRRSLTIFDFIIGAEECTNTAYTDFCNGRLQPNMEYIIIATACTSGGCLLSKHYGPFKTLEEMKCPESCSSTAAIVIGVVMGVIILVLATYAAYVTIQNRKYKAKNDTAPGTKSRTKTFSSPIYINETFTDSNEQRLFRPKEESSANEDSQYSSLDETTRTERLTYETLHAF